MTIFPALAREANIPCSAGSPLDYPALSSILPALSVATVQCRPMTESPFDLRQLQSGAVSKGSRQATPVVEKARVLCLRDLLKVNPAPTGSSNPQVLNKILCIFGIPKFASQARGSSAPRLR